jgi:hypothetical protein
MTRTNLLVLQIPNSQLNQFTQNEKLSDLQVTEVPSLENVYCALESGAVDCVLVNGALGDLDPVEIL